MRGAPARRLAAPLLSMLALFIASSTAGQPRESPAAGVEGAPRGDAPLRPIALWTFDPSRFATAAEEGPARLAATALLRAAVVGGLIEDEETALLLELALVGATIGDAPHTVALLDVKAHERDVLNEVVLDRLQAVIEVRTGEGHRGLLRTVRSIVVDRYSEEGERSQEAITLPGGREGVAFRAASWPDWLSVSWASLPNRFVVGIGEDALGDWLGGGGGGPDSTRAPGAHRRAVDAARPAGEAFLFAGVDLDALRARAASVLARGRLRRLLEASRLGAARSFWLHGRWVDAPAGGGAPPLLALDATWESRLDPPGRVRRKLVSLDDWAGAGLRTPPPDGSYALLLPVSWDGLIGRALTMRLALTKDRRIRERRTSLQRWASREGRALRRALESLHPVLVITDDPTPPLPAPGLATWMAETRPGASASAVAGVLARVLESVAETTRSADGIFSLRLDPAGAIRVPAWGGAGEGDAQALVAGWAPACVLAQRERLGDADAESDTSGRPAR